MSGPIVRTGTTPEYGDAWDRIFSGEGNSKKTAKKKAGKKKKAAAKKKAAPKKKAAKKKVAKKKKK